MPYTIHIHNVQKRVPVSENFLKNVIRKVFKRQKIRNADLSVIITTDRRIREINKTFLGHDFPTDVITFDLSSKELSRQKRFHVRDLEGEIYVSAVTASRQAKEFSVSPQQELVLYIVHGILHLIGYDDHGAADRKKMRKKEKEILFEIGDLISEGSRK